MFGVVSLGYSQQEVQYSQYMFTIPTFNPGYVGMNGSMCATGLFNKPFTGVEVYNPDMTKYKPTTNTSLFMFDAPVRVLHGGLGINVYYDQFDHFKSTGVELMYSYHLNILNGVLGFGPKINFIDQRVDLEGLVGSETDKTDPVLLNLAEQGKMMFDLGFGAFYKEPSALYVGLSVNRIIQSNLDFDKAGSYTFKRMYYLTGGYEFDLPANPSFKLLPSVLVKTDFSTTNKQKEGKSMKKGLNVTADFSCLLEYENTVWGGLTLRPMSAVGLLAGGNVKNFKLGLAYELPTSKLGFFYNSDTKQSGGTLELFARYCFKIKRIPKFTSHENTRFL